ncbi:unnamed protein product [Polarella glacialis]|uniref:Uncharacterized protein n=1 Tax=Polarella glacialis TaxID=89957 RepID=A0A813HT59_POLGL|nr:unnamed protein product [Polarella glacialis]
MCSSKDCKVRRAAFGSLAAVIGTTVYSFLYAKFVVPCFSEVFFDDDSGVREAAAIGLTRCISKMFFLSDDGVREETDDWLTIDWRFGGPVSLALLQQLCHLGASTSEWQKRLQSASTDLQAACFSLSQALLQVLPGHAASNEEAWDEAGSAKDAVCYVRLASVLIMGRLLRAGQLAEPSEILGVVSTHGVSNQAWTVRKASIELLVSIAPRGAGCANAVAKLFKREKTEAVKHAIHSFFECYKGEVAIASTGALAAHVPQLRCDDSDSGYDTAEYEYENSHVPFFDPESAENIEQYVENGSSWPAFANRTREENRQGLHGAASLTAGEKKAVRRRAATEQADKPDYASRSRLQDRELEAARKQKLAEAGRLLLGFSFEG